MSNQADHGFPPIVGANPRILILGSMPSQKSLEKQQYYGHPQNAFWKIMAKFFNFEPSLDYSERKTIVADKGIAIWDVIQTCVRPGSLDSSIQKETIVVNDFESMLNQHPSLTKIICNGGTAHTLFTRHLKGWLSTHPEITLVKMPSTSPAHASLNFDQKYEVWASELQL